LETLCQTYWYPLYAYVRRCGHGPQDAEDLTQGFLVKLIEKDLARAADRALGRFRSFLLSSLKHFMADQRRRANAQKRGGSMGVIPLDVETAETRYHLEAADDWNADKVFEHHWAMTVLETVLARLRGQYEVEGKATLFNEAKSSLTRSGTAVPYADLAVRLNMSEGAVRVAVHRLRRRYRDLLRQEIAHTVANPAEVDEEIRHLFEALARRS
jgi:RNA polymerase sigma-70 factor (ECF subfamily)